MAEPQVGETFIDFGEGNVDFQSFWYSTTYFIGMLNIYRSIFGNTVEYEVMLRRFLISHEIAFHNRSSLDNLQFLFQNWLGEMQARGTGEVALSHNASEEVGASNVPLTGVIEVDIKNREGLGVLANLNGFSLLNPLPLVNYFTISFDTFVNGSVDSLVVDGFLKLQVISSGIEIDGETDLKIVISSSSEDFTLLDSTCQFNHLLHIKVLTIPGKSLLYMNDEFLGSVVTNLLGLSISKINVGAGLVLANLRVTNLRSLGSKINEYVWLMNEGSGFAVNCSNHDFNASANVNPDQPWDTIWVRRSDFKNTNYKGLDGEVRRLVSYDDGEFIFEKINDSEVGVTVGLSSFNSSEANLVNINKAFEKGVVDRISNYPIKFSQTITPVVENGCIEYQLSATEQGFWGINPDLFTDKDWKTNPNYKPTGLIPFIPIPISGVEDNFDGYEVSFDIKTTAAIAIDFAVIPYDIDLNPLESVLNSYGSDVANDYLMSSVDFDLAVGRFVKVRGVLSNVKLPTVSNSNNLGVGNNLYMNGSAIGVKYIVPIIRFKSLAEDVLVQIRNISVYPLSLPTDKGVISPKNIIFAYLKNNSGRYDSDVESTIQSDLVPNNCLINIKFI